MTGEHGTKSLFKAQLTDYKQQIDSDIEAYAGYIRESTLEQYGEVARLEVDAFLAILERGGKRIRGALTLCGYEMSGGTDKKMILQAARAVEMLHAYLLIIDDIQDNSLVRRGGPSAHALLTDYHHKHHLKGDAAHFGVSLAMSSAMAGAHAAMTILANLQVTPLLRANTVSIMNRTLLVTHHGQVNDIMNEATHKASLRDIERVMDWKSATYSFLNPLHVGMVLAGADCHATDAITPFAHQVGIAFQITDDILGTFSDEEVSGKSPMDDVREGKHTLLVHYALTHAGAKDKALISSVLGDPEITHEQFAQYKEVLVRSGAHEYATSEARRYIDAALTSLETESNRWPASKVAFLRGLAESLLSRVA